MPDTDIYRKQKFGQTIKLGRTPALLVVDFVNGFIDPEMFGGGNILAAAQKTRTVIETFRKHGAPIAYSRIVYAVDGSDTGVWCEKAPRLAELTEDSPASQIVDFLQPDAGDIIIRKTQASAFFETGLSSIFRLCGVDTVVVAGATTSGCVRASVVDAISLNFRPVVVTDCVGDRAIGPHEANLFDIGQKYANTVHSGEVATLFAQDA
jgi:maleamate amidohydrolase